MKLEHAQRHSTFDLLLVLVKVQHIFIDIECLIFIVIFETWSLEKEVVPNLNNIFTRVQMSVNQIEYSWTHYSDEEFVFYWLPPELLSVFDVLDFNTGPTAAVSWTVKENQHALSNVITKALDLFISTINLLNVKLLFGIGVVFDVHELQLHLLEYFIIVILSNYQIFFDADQSLLECVLDPHDLIFALGPRPELTFMEHEQDQFLVVFDLLTLWLRSTMDIQ